MKTKAFISYSHNDKDLRDKVKLAFLSNNNIDIEPITDEKAARGRPLHKEVSKLVNESHVIIPIITKNWLNSHETRDELVRAHERRKTIICFLNSDDYPNTNDLPFYIREALRIHFDKNNFELKIVELISAIKNFNEHWKLEILDGVRKLGDWVCKNSYLPIYKRKHLSARVKRSHCDAAQIVNSSDFKLRVSYEDNFLLSASPYFSTANEIYAISMANISTFWSDENAYDAAQKYLQEQSGQNRLITRLFVFETPTQVNEFKNILQANFSSYGRNGGGVFFTSHSSYLTLINSITRDASFLKKIQNVDFGLLKYKEASGEEKYLLTTLDKTDLSISSIEHDEYITSSLKLFHEIMVSLQKIEEGGCSESMNIARWSTRMYKERDFLAHKLSKIFPESKSNIVHLVMIDANNNDKNVKKCLDSLIIKFQENMKDLNIIDIWFHEKHEVIAHDGQFLGIINTQQKYDYIISVEFENEDSLISYYQHRIHSIEREALYKSIYPSIEKEYSELKRLQKTKGNRAAISSKFSEVEEIMDNYIMRTDVLIEESVKNVVRKPGIPFGAKLAL